MWDSPEAPADEESHNIFYLLCDCPSMGQDARMGQCWTGVKVTVGSGADMKEVVKWQKVE